MTPVASRIGNDVSYVRTIKQSSHFSWSLFVAGTVLGEVQVALFGAGAVLGEVQVALFVAGAVFGEVQVTLSWQAPYLVKV